MITYIVSDLFQSPARVLVNTVNTVGVMGKGIALEFKYIYPKMFEQYQIFCERGQFDIGQLWLYKTPHKWILNFPTKKHWREKAHTQYIEAGLKKFVSTYDVKGITSISFPMLGCGNGELDWETQVQPLMEKYLKNLPIDIYIHLHNQKDPFAPEHRDIKRIESWLRGEPQSLAYTEFWEDLSSYARQKMKFSVINHNYKSFHVELDTGGTGVIIYQDGGDPIILDEGSLIDFWQYMRVAGFCSPQNLPSNFKKHSDIIITLLSQIDYLRLVLISDQDNPTEQQTGLQLIPSLQINPNILASALKVAKPA